MKNPQKLYEGNVRKKYFFFAIPLIISALVSQSYGVINSMMIGKFLGSEAFAATAVTANLIELLSSILWGYLAGMAVYVSALFGKSEYDKMLNSIKGIFLVSSLFSIFATLGCNIFSDGIFKILNVNDEVYKNAEIYFKTYTSGFIFFQFNWGFIFISNGMGMTRFPLTVSVISGVINVLLNYIFLSVFGKGIGYSALSSVISSAVATAIYFYFYIKLFRKMGIKNTRIKIGKDFCLSSKDYGIPTMFQQMMLYLCTTLVSPLINTCPTAALSGYTVANKAKGLVSECYKNSTKANTNFIAQAIGGRRIDRIKEGIKVGAVQSLLFFGVTLLGFMIFAKGFTSLFLDPIKDAESFTVSINMIRFLFPLMFFNVFTHLLQGTFRAVGAGRVMVISTVIYAVSYVVYAYALFDLLPDDMLIYAADLSLGGAYITELIYSGAVYISGRWKSEEYIEIEKAQIKHPS